MVLSREVAEVLRGFCGLLRGYEAALSNQRLDLGNGMRSTQHVTYPERIMNKTCAKRRLGEKEK